METSPIESVPIPASTPIVIPKTEYQSNSNNDEESDKNLLKENSTESGLKSTKNEVFDLIKSEIKKEKSSSKNELNSSDNDKNEIKTESVGTSTDDTKLSSSQTKKTILEEHGFRIGNEIGSGTYAKVKVAYSVEHKCAVAVKIITKFKAPSAYLKKFFPREIDVVKGLRHENLIKFYQSIETTHRIYIIMELAEKGSLFELIRKEKFLNNTRAKKYYKQLINVIDYCHSKGVVHRDIKCENILLDKNMNLKLIDFGFARGKMFPIRDVPILSQTYCGSYAYASPEILKGIPYDPHMSDIWATGVVLYSMVYGRLPYDGSNCYDLLRQVEAKLIFPKQPTEVPFECKNLLLKVLAPLKIRYQIEKIQQDKWLSFDEI